MNAGDEDRGLLYIRQILAEKRYNEGAPNNKRGKQEKNTHTHA
jgi:hypothetical protein